MAKYLGYDGKWHHIDLKSMEPCNEQDLSDRLIGRKPAHDSFGDYLLLKGNKTTIEMFKYLDPSFKNLYDLRVMFAARVKYDEKDKLKLHPVFTKLVLAGESSIINLYQIKLSRNETILCENLIYEHLADHHTPEMQAIMSAYYDSIDDEVLNFVNDVESGRDVVPITVGYLNQKQLKEIESKVNVSGISTRCVMDSSSITHIQKRHGKKGSHDRNLKNNEDIARIPFILANYDEVDFDGVYSKRFRLSSGEPAPHIVLKKRIDGTYFIVEAVSDSKKNRNYIVSAYLSDVDDEN